MTSRRITHLPLTARRPGMASERVFIWVARFAVFAPLAVLAVLLGQIAIDGFGRIDWNFITGLPSRRPAEAGMWPAIIGSLWLIGLTVLFALPIGVAAAIYLEEYGRTSRLAGIVEVAIANLAGVPSIIYGILGLGVFVRFAGLGRSVIAGALTLSILVLPIVIMSTREALRTVRDSLREAAMGLGATRWQMVWRVVLPMSLPGILTGAILAVSRAIGETAPIVVVGAFAFMGFAPDGLDSIFSAMPIQIFGWTKMPQRAFLVNAAAGMCVLIVVLLILNSLAIWLRNRYQKRAY
jgi:phosphate transport system permease protein